MPFDLNIARICLQSSADAYTVSPTIESVLAHVLIGRMNPLTPTLSPSDGARESAIVIAFRGTAEIRDWVTDLDCWKTKLWKDVKVHEGFWCAIQMVLREIKERISGSADFNKQNAEFKLYLTGHSLGGAMAMLCAWLLERGEFPVEAVYTFGQPRVGNGAFATAYQRSGKVGGVCGWSATQPRSGKTLGERTWRFVNQEDIVPRVPGLLAGFRHAGNEVFLPSVGPMTMNPAIWFKAVSDGIGLYREWKLGRIALLADHRVRAYMGRLMPGRNYTADFDFEQKETEGTKL